MISRMISRMKTAQASLQDYSTSDHCDARSYFDLYSYGDLVESWTDCLVQETAVSAYRPVLQVQSHVQNGKSIILRGSLYRTIQKSLVPPHIDRSREESSVFSQRLVRGSRPNHFYFHSHRDHPKIPWKTLKREDLEFLIKQPPIKLRPTTRNGKVIRY